MNFFVLRITLNLGFALGAVSFFVGGTMPWLVGGAIFFGVSNSGADVAWSLWVTKFAPPDRVADYMSVHTFFTGVRGVVRRLSHSLVSPFAQLIGWLPRDSHAFRSSFEIRFSEARSAALVEEFGMSWTNFSLLPPTLHGRPRD
jgi:hypothetical protein